MKIKKFRKFIPSFYEGDGNQRRVSYKELIELGDLFNEQVNKYRIDFEWKEKERPDWQTRYLRDRHRILGTAYVDAKTLRLLRFKGKVGNAFVRYNNSQTLPNEINFQINYDYSKGYPAVNNLSVEGGNKQLQYKMLLFNVQDDNLLAEGGILSCGKSTTSSSELPKRN